MAAKKIVHIKWPNFESDFSGGFVSYFENHHLSDVSIGTEDKLKIKAHKIVLSIGSGYFRKIFEMDSTSAFVFLPEIDSKIVKFVLFLMYHGSVNIPNKDLNAFIKAASFLRLNGFEGSNSNASQSKNVSIENVDGDSNQSVNNSRKRKRYRVQSEGNGSREDGKIQLRKKRTSFIVEDTNRDDNIISISSAISDVELRLSSYQGSLSDSSIDLMN